MTFEKGKYYGFKGSQHMVMFIAGSLGTKTWGDSLIGEVMIRGSLPALRAVGQDEIHAEGWEEVTEEMFVDTTAHWIDEFTQHYEKVASKEEKAKEMGVNTAFRKVVRYVKHPQLGTMTVQLLCGHTLRFRKDEWEFLVKEGREPKVGSMQLCATCDIQNRAIMQNDLIDKDTLLRQLKGDKPDEKKEQGNSILFPSSGIKIDGSGVK